MIYKDQQLLEEAYRKTLVKEDPDVSFSSLYDRDIGFKEDDAKAFGFLDLTKRIPMVDWMDGIVIGHLEGFGPEWKDLFLFSEFTHQKLFKDVFDKMWQSSQGIISINKSDKEPPIVFNLGEMDQQDRDYLFDTLIDLVAEVNVREILSPAGRIWTKFKVISFWTDKDQVTPNHLNRIFNELKIPRQQMDEYYVEFLGEDKPERTVSQYINNSGGERSLSPEEQKEKEKRKAEALAKMHVAGAAGTKDVDVQNLLDKRKQELVQADAEARRTGKIPDIKTRQQAMTSESLTYRREQDLLQETYNQILNKEDSSQPTLVLLSNVPISEGLKYHLENNIPLTDPIYRIYSEKYFDLLEEVRSLYEEDHLAITDEIEELLETDIGEKAIFEGREVYLDAPIFTEEDEMLEEAAKKKQGKHRLGSPFRTPGGPKKFAVYVRAKNGNVKKVTFGDPNMRVRNNSPARAKSFRARHKCSEKKDRTTAGYWSCRVSRYRKALGLKSSRVW